MIVKVHYAKLHGRKIRTERYMKELKL